MCSMRAVVRRMRQGNIGHSVRMGRSWGGVVAIMVLCAMVLLGVANGHGSMQDPVSRVLNCYNEGPENPKSAACKAAVASSGTQAFYDWMEVNQPSAGGRHREIIPDGQLCSGGRDKYKGLDLARSDWTATSLASGVAFTYLYKVTAAHMGYFDFYVTRDGYEATEPLKWADLEDSPFLTAPTTHDSSSYQISGTTPAGKSGRHLIYMIWQRTDSQEAFYSCSDVDFVDALSVLHSTT